MLRAVASGLEKSGEALLAGGVAGSPKGRSEAIGSKIGIPASQRCISDADSTASSHMSPSGVKRAKPKGCTGEGRGTACWMSPCARCPGCACAAASAPLESETRGSCR